MPRASFVSNAPASGPSARSTSVRDQRPAAARTLAPMMLTTPGTSRSAAARARMVSACRANTTMRSVVCSASKRLSAAARAAVSRAISGAMRCRMVRTASRCASSCARAACTSNRSDVSVRSSSAANESCTASSTRTHRAIAAREGTRPSARRASNAMPRCRRRRNATSSAARLDCHANANDITMSGNATRPSAAGSGGGSARSASASPATLDAASRGGSVTTRAGITRASSPRTTTRASVDARSACARSPRKSASRWSRSARRFTTGVAVSSNTGRPTQRPAKARYRCVFGVRAWCASSTITRPALAPAVALAGAQAAGERRNASILVNRIVTPARAAARSH